MLTILGRILISAACCLAVIGCGPQRREPTSAQDVRPECPPAASETYFFPSGESDRFINDPAPARILTVMQAPALSCGQVQFSEVYRLIGVPVFDRPPIAVTATLQNGTWALRGVVFRSSSDLIATIDKTRPLSREEAVALTEAIGESKFWMSAGRDTATDIVVFDGATWILEARRNSSYHIVSRQLLRDEPFHTLGGMLVRLAGLDATLQEIGLN